LIFLNPSTVARFGRVSKNDLTHVAPPPCPFGHGREAGLTTEPQPPSGEEEGPEPPPSMAIDGLASLSIQTDASSWLKRAPA